MVFKIKDAHHITTTNLNYQQHLYIFICVSLHIKLQNWDDEINADYIRHWNFFWQKFLFFSKYFDDKKKPTVKTKNEQNTSKKKPQQK